MFFIFLFLLNFVYFKFALAVCPICTIAVASGVEISRRIGVDDLIIGLWIGGLAVSLVLWTESFLDKKNIKFKGRIYVNILFYYLLTYVSLKLSNLINTSYKIYIFPKILLGLILGSIAFWWTNTFYNYLKEKNNGKPYFPFQKVVMPITTLLILSVFFYLLIN